MFSTTYHLGNKTKQKEVEMINVDTIERKIKMGAVLKNKTEIQVELFIREKGSAILVAEDIALIMELENLDDLESAFEIISNH